MVGCKISYASTDKFSTSFVFPLILDSWCNTDIIESFSGFELPILAKGFGITGSNEVVSLAGGFRDVPFLVKDSTGFKLKADSGQFHFSKRNWYAHSETAIYAPADTLFDKATSA